eukprot:9940252-Ditylum_brightwellii.AAC.1
MAHRKIIRKIVLFHFFVCKFTASNKIAIMAGHIAEQMNETLTPPSLHWPYFCKRAAARAYQMTKVAKIETEPCKKGSHWHRFAFMQIDLWISEEWDKASDKNYATPGHTFQVQNLTYSGAKTAVLFSVL